MAPVGDELSQELTIIQKQGGRPEIREIMGCRFVKLIGGRGLGRSRTVRVAALELA